MNKRLYTFIISITLVLTGLMACDSLTGKDDAFTEELEEKMSMIQSEMGAIVATGDSIKMHLKKVSTLQSDPDRDSSEINFDDLENALLVLSRKQENLENAYGSLVNDYRQILESYRSGDTSEEEARNTLDQLSDRPVMLMKNHESLLQNLVQVQEQINKAEKLIEEGARQRV